MRAMRATRLHALSMTSEGESRRRLLEADFTSFKMACVASLIASVTSVEGSVIVRGSPSTWSRPRTSERDLLLQRQALPIWILTPQRPLADDQVVALLHVGASMSVRCGCRPRMELLTTMSISEMTAASQVPPRCR